MNFFFLFILIFFSFVCSAQERFNYYKIDTVQVNNLSTLKKRSFYQTNDSKELLFYIKNSDRKYKLIFTFTHWCKPCKVMHPKVLSLKENKDLDIFFLTDAYDGRDFLSTEKYLDEIGNVSPIFSLGDNSRFMNNRKKYDYFIYDPKKQKKVKVNRYDFFIQNLIPNHHDYGYSLLVLYNQKNQPVYASTFKETDEQIMKKIKAIIDNQ